MKKLLALVLAAAMVLALVPMTAMAAETITTFEQLKNYADNGGEVTLGNNITITNSPLLVSRDLTINLNGKTISKGTPWNEGDSLIIIKNGGKLTINGTGAIDGGHQVWRCK